MSRKSTLLCCLAAILVLILVGCSTVGPLCRSGEKVRASILKRTPLGCSSEQVYTFIKQQRWPASYEETEGLAPGRTAAGGIEVARELGTTHFLLFPFETTVIAYWIFDKDGRLIDVRIIQDTDAL
jgi:hypothetical protein